MIFYSNVNPPASNDDITVACDQLNIAKSGWLVEFWKVHDGALLNDRVLIYSTACVAERNDTYQISMNFPDHVLVGDDSGGYLILIPKVGPSEFYYIDSGDPFIDDAEIYGSMDDLVKLFVVSEDFDFDPDIGDIVSISKVKAKLSEVLGVKKGLGLACSTKVLVERLEVENSILLQSVNVNSYRKVLATYNHLISFLSQS